MAKTKKFASSIEDSLIGRQNSNESENTVTKTVKTLKTTETSQTPETLKTSKPLPASETIAKLKTKETTKTLETVAVGFNLTEEDAKFIKRASAWNRITKEELFHAVFTEALSYEIDFDDPDYDLFSERFKKPVRYTTKIDKELYQKMQDHAANCYLKINGYINYMIRLYRNKHES